ncbi:hypothetical protein [Culturomica massiliensis]|jgi:hypothetical protein|uniref:hypothetical protein n=1 Tax=Culturomica massiliensis TaxID=1841857 RepID=UPI002357B559|nr:hypothetical protein [Culturomica massiliensis]
MSNKDMKHWGYDLIGALCCLAMFIIGVNNYNVLLYEGNGRGSSIGALMRLLDRLFGNKNVPLGLLLIVAILFILNAYRKWRKSK